VKRFISEKNIQHFNVLLSQESDERQRRVLLTLIAEEEEKLSRIANKGLGSANDPMSDR
jgi:hypothetical protein